MSESKEGDFVLVPRRELDDLKARVQVLETSAPEPEVRDAVAEQFAAFVGRVKDLERQGRA